LLFLTGSTAAYHWFRTAGDPEAGLTFVRVVTWYGLPVVLLVVLALDSMFLDRLSLSLRRGVVAGVAGLPVLGLGAHLLEPSWVYTVADTAHETTVASAASRWQVLPEAGAILDGVLFDLAWGLAVVVGALAAHDSSRSTVQRRRAGLVGLAFAFQVAHGGALATTITALDPARLAIPRVGFHAAATIAVLVALVWPWPRLDDPFKGRARPLVLAALLAPILAGVATGNLPGSMCR
jgi:hypothetical protein